MTGIFNHFKTFVLLALLTGLMLGIGSFFGEQGFFIALIFVLIMNFGTYFFSHKIVLWMYKAKPADEKRYRELHAMVKEVSALAGIPKPRVYIIPSNSYNAFATGRNPKNGVVAVTDGIMQLLTKEELKGVIAHEMSHIKNRDILIQTIAATIAGVISYLSHMAVWFGFGGSDDDNGGILGILLIAILAPIIAMIIQLAISRSREYLADESGAKTIHNPKALADALEKLERGISHNPMKFGDNSTSSLFIANPFNAKGIIALFSTHPPLEDRVQRLRKMKI